MGKIKCIIVDDEEHAVEVIEHFSERIPYLDIIGRFTDPIEATHFIGLEKDRIDLVFLDIEMPKFSGIDFLKAYSFPHVILATAYADYALPSYEYGVVDYLLKPYGFDRFSKAVGKVYERMQLSNHSNSVAIEQETDTFIIKTARNKYERIAQEDILYIEGAKNYAVIKTAEEDIVCNLRLKNLEEQLPKNQFVRVHNSFIVNLTHFKSLDNGSLTLKGVQKKIAVGTHYKNSLVDLIQKEVWE